MKRIAILQPEVPHYRKEFFELLSERVTGQDIYVYNSIESSKTRGFDIDETTVNYIPNKKFHGMLLYSIRPLLSNKYSTLVLMLQFSHVSTWMLLLTKKFYRKKIILWGQGISVKRYLSEEKRPDIKLKLMISLADGIMFYTDKELEMWKKYFPKKQMISLNNTISGVDKMICFTPALTKKELKEKYNVKEKTILIFCARFESNYRRVDLLLEIINSLDPKKFGFIIIGDGKNKPNFSDYPNVHDFGAVYDNTIKQELFSCSDIYFQPGWVGLSIVEAMAYGKPIFTFQRSNKTKQCVEYSYIKHGENGLIFQDVKECVKTIQSISPSDINELGNNAREYVKKHLLMEDMVKNADTLIMRL